MIDAFKDGVKLGGESGRKGRRTANISAFGLRYLSFFLYETKVGVKPNDNGDLFTTGGRVEFGRTFLLAHPSSSRTRSMYWST